MTDFADIQNKRNVEVTDQWQRRFLKNWAADTKGRDYLTMLDFIRRRRTGNGYLGKTAFRLSLDLHVTS